MNKLHKNGLGAKTAALLAFIFISIFCVVFFADRGRFELPFSTPAVLTLLAPFQRAAAWAGSGIKGFFADAWEVFSVREQNKMLRNEIRELRAQNRQAAEFAAENIRLRELLGYKQVATQFDLVMGSVIGREAASWTSVIVIDRGANDGIKKNMPVVTAHGLVGRIKDAGPISSRVELMIDPRTAVAALTQRSRVVGIVQGDITDQFSSRMVNIPRNADVKVGDDVVTSGFGGIFPKGIAVGKIVEVKNDSGGLLKYAILESAVNFQQLEDVAIIINSREAPPAPLPPPKTVSPKARALP